MKKLSILFIVIILALSLAACGVGRTTHITGDESGIHTENETVTENADDAADTSAANDSADASTSGADSTDREQSDAYSEDNGERKTDGNTASDENDAETVGTATDVIEPHAAPAPETERDTASESKTADVTERRETEKAETRAPETTAKPETTAAAPETVPAPETTASPSVERPAGSSYAEEVTRLVNEIRREHGLSELTLDAELSRVAEAKSRDMSERGYFAHESPTYGSPFDMMKSFGIRYRSAGENIARGYRTPEAVVDAWMNSEGHRANILSPKFTKIGVGYIADGNYWTQMFTG